MMSVRPSNVMSKVEEFTDPLFDRDVSQRIRCEVENHLPLHLKEKALSFNTWAKDMTLAWSDFPHTIELRQLGDLSRYFSESFLIGTRAIPVDTCPDVPYGSFGLEGVRLPRGGELGGLACGDFYFIKTSLSAWQPTHFHELIHVAQWRILGAEAYIGLLLLGLKTQGYRLSPLEKMAYGLQDRFGSGRGTFDAVAEVYSHLRKLQPSGMGMTLS
jgi:hypothetical protein